METLCVSNQDTKTIDTSGRPAQDTQWLLEPELEGSNFNDKDWHDTK